MQNPQKFDLEGAFKRRLVQRLIARGNREVRWVLKANAHQIVARSGGGAREVARRARQIAAGKLKVTQP